MIIYGYIPEVDDDGNVILTLDFDNSSNMSLLMQSYAETLSGRPSNSNSFITNNSFLILVVCFFFFNTFTLNVVSVLMNEYEYASICF